MVEIKSKLKIARSAYKVEVKGQLRLPFESRQKSRLRTKLVSGEEVALMLPRGEVLRGGDLVTASDGRVIEVGEIEGPDGRKRLRVGVFLSVFDVHVNSAPVAGRVVSIERGGSRFLAAFERRAEREKVR